MLVLDAQPGEQPDPEPESGRAAVNDSYQEIDATHPEQRFERVHGKEIAVYYIYRGGERGGATQRYRPNAPPHLARDHASEHDRGRAREGR